MGSGLFLGVLITGLFGFMPTLIAGQVRPAMVLRPNEAEMPAAGLLQTLLTLLVMIAVLGALVSSIVGGSFAVGPVIMIAGGGALVGLFAGVIAANRRRPCQRGANAGCAIGWGWGMARRAVVRRAGRRRGAGVGSAADCGGHSTVRGRCRFARHYCTGGARR